MRFVAADTNFVLHFKPLTEIAADDLGLVGDFTWLVVGQVMHELDVRKGTGDKTLRKRARKAVQAFEKADAQPGTWAGAHPLRVHFRTRDFDFEANGLLRNEGDHKVIADILDFRVDHPNDEVLLLSDDSGARIRARRHGIETIEAPEIVARPEIEDERDEQLRGLEQKYRDLSATQPDLQLAFEGEAREIQAIVATFDQAEFEELMRQAAMPESDQPEVAAPGVHADWIRMLQIASPRRPNPDYESQIAVYGEKFREYFVASWVQKYRTVEISPVLHSRNGVEARAVRVRIRMKTQAEVAVKRPENVKAPAKPRRMLDVYAGLRPGSVTDFVRTIRPWNLPEVDVLRPTVQSNDGAVVKYGLMRLAQEDYTALDPFWLIFDHDVVPSAAIELEYEVRASNMTRVVRDTLLVRFDTREKKMPARYVMEATQ